LIRHGWVANCQASSRQGNLIWQGPQAWMTNLNLNERSFI
jgi:hypothetical protein